MEKIGDVCTLTILWQMKIVNATMKKDLLLEDECVTGLLQTRRRRRRRGGLLIV